MRHLLLIVSTLIFLLFACKDETNLTIEDGTYTGTFQRKPVWSDGQLANISIAFSSGSWSGQSDIVKYPALCRGSYTIEGNKIIFTNDCIWTAEFDWSLILGGEYLISIDNGIIEITRDYSNAYTDAYEDIYLLEIEK